MELGKSYVSKNQNAQEGTHLESLNISFHHLQRTQIIE